MKKYEISFMLKTGNSGMQKTIVMASDPSTAKRIWEQANPNCRFSSYREVH